MRQIKKIKLRQIQRLSGSDFMCKASVDSNLWFSFIPGESALVYPLSFVDNVYACFDMQNCKIIYVWQTVGDMCLESLSD